MLFRSVYGITTLSNAALLSSTLGVQGAAMLSNTLDVYGATTLSNSATIYGITTLSNAALLSSTLGVQGAAMLSNTLDVYGATTLSNSATIYGVTTLSNAALLSSTLGVQGAAMLSNTLEVYGVTTLSNSATVYGITTLSNAALLSSTLGVQGATMLSNALTVYGITTLSNAATISSNLTVKGDSTLSNSLTVWGPTTLSNVDITGSVHITSNLTIDGVLNVQRMETSYSNVTFFTSEEITSNLLVDGYFTASNASSFQSNLAVFGPASFSNAVSVYDKSTYYNTQLASNALITFSNDVSSAVIGCESSNIGIGQPAGSNPLFTLDVFGDINFSGKIYQKGAIFSGWNSNAWGNYINSNAAFKGPSTEGDALMVYTQINPDGSNLPFSMSNAIGATSLHSYSSNLGLQTAAGSNPLFTLDVNGDINFSGKIYQAGALFSGWNSNAWGNYINSNAAFKGPSTAGDALMVYTHVNPDGSNLPFSMSNATGTASIYNVASFLGFGGASNPEYVVDVLGSVRSTLSVYAGSNIGIGTLTPSAPLDVQNNVTGVSIYSSAKVVASEFSIYSDSRIKTDVRTVDPADYLAMIEGVQVREYRYIDKTEKGVGSKIGFIAQEVEAVAPSCVETVSEYVPNIFAECKIVSISAGGKTAIVDLGLQVSGVQEGTMLKLRTVPDGRLLHGAVKSEFAGIVTLQLDGAVGEMDDRVFVVGTRIDDFKMLNHEQLNSVAIGAIKAQIGAMAAQQVRIDALEAAVAALTKAA